jgi:hypothetical protein
MTITSKKKHTIDSLIEMRNSIDSLLADLCPPCPECCPPQFPGNPGELVDHGRGEISMCENCWGRGYIVP